MSLVFCENSLRGRERFVRAICGRSGTPPTFTAWEKDDLALPKILRKEVRGESERMVGKCEENGRKKEGE